MSDGFVLATEISTRILTMTVEVWRARPDGARTEPIDSAWRRLFGEPLNGQVPIMFMPTLWEERMIGMCLYRHGRVSVDDPLSGRSIRVIRPEFLAAREQIGNVADALAEAHPTAAWIQRERPDGFGSLPATFAHVHHAKVGGSAQEFLLQGV